VARFGRKRLQVDVSVEVLQMGATSTIGAPSNDQHISPETSEEGVHEKPASTKNALRSAKSVQKDGAASGAAIHEAFVPPSLGHKNPLSPKQIIAQAMQQHPQVFPDSPSNRIPQSPQNIIAQAMQQPPQVFPNSPSNRTPKSQQAYIAQLQKNALAKAAQEEASMSQNGAQTKSSAQKPKKGKTGSSPPPLCLDYLNGTCSQLRQHCRYYHPKPGEAIQNVPLVAPSANVCEVWALTGFCKFGKACWKSHPTSPQVTPTNNQISKPLTKNFEEWKSTSHISKPLAKNVEDWKLSEGADTLVQERKGSKSRTPKAKKAGNRSGRELFHPKLLTDAMEVPIMAL
jgi:hypothetical protein